MELLHGDCREMLKQLPDASADSIVTDPPYELGFMGKSWDSTGVAYDVTVWQECLRVLKPGGHLLAFGGSRTYHRLAVAIEDAGFQIRDQIMWVYGSGFPKSHNIGKQDGCEEWTGWGTALKPAHEPIVMARKPLDGTVANNVLKHGVGGINIDGTRVPGEPVPINKLENWSGFGQDIRPDYTQEVNTQGRFPANFIHDGSKEVLELLGNPARFFYSAKASKAERNAGLDPDLFPLKNYTDANKMGGSGDTMLTGSGNPRDGRKHNHHPTVKPIALMRYLVRLVTPPNGKVLDPFAGSGTTLVAAIMEKFDCIGIEMTDEYLPIIEARVAHAITDTLF
jgi:DNA modification methylase